MVFWVRSHFIRIGFSRLSSLFLSELLPSSRADNISFDFPLRVSLDSVLLFQNRISAHLSNLQEAAMDGIDEVYDYFISYFYKLLYHALNFRSFALKYMIFLTEMLTFFENLHALIIFILLFLPVSFSVQILFEKNFSGKITADQSNFLFHYFCERYLVDLRATIFSFNVFGTFLFLA